MNNNLIERIVHGNMNMMSGEFKYEFGIRQEGEATIAMVDIIGEHTFFDIEIRNGMFIGVTLTATGSTHLLKDLAPIIRCIETKINQFGKADDVIYDGGDFVVTNFTELGIDYPNSNKRDLLVNRTGMYSIIRFSDGMPKTKELTKDKVKALIREKLEEEGCTLDLTNCEVLEFVDESEYMDYDVED